jgi:Flp pilus assembly pilin Flp
MRKTLKRLRRDASGQDLAEYGIGLAVVTVVAATAAIGIAMDTKLIWTRALQAIIVALLSL